MFDYLEMVKEKYSIGLKRNVFIIGTPSHGNLGDHAIWYATERILQKIFLDANIVDVLIEDFPTDIDAIYQLIKKGDIIILQGGGNLGNYYMDDEMIRRYVIGRFHKNRIIMFPQSVDFSQDALGEQQLLISKKIYEHNKNLVLLARDRKSYAYLKEKISVPVYELPDVVLTLNLCSDAKKRKGALLCLRNDRESARSEQEKEKITSFLKEKFETVVITDTIAQTFEWKKDRENMLLKKFQEFKEAELIVTDRLHGMIFAAVTGTPCIILPNCNAKIENEHEYLSDLGYLALIHSIDELEDAYANVTKISMPYYNEKKYEDIFREFISKYIVDDIGDSETDLLLDGIMEAGSYWDKNTCETRYWFNKLKVDYEKSCEEKKELQKAINDYGYKYAELEKNQNELRSNYENMIEDNRAIRNVIDEYQVKYCQLEQWHNQLKENYEKSIAEKSDLQKVIDDYHKKYVELEKWHMQLKEAYIDLQKVQ